MKTVLLGQLSQIAAKQYASYARQEHTLGEWPSPNAVCAAMVNTLTRQALPSARHVSLAKSSQIKARLNVTNVLQENTALFRKQKYAKSAHAVPNVTRQDLQITQYVRLANTSRRQARPRASTVQRGRTVGGKRPANAIFAPVVLTNPLRVKKLGSSVRLEHTKMRRVNQNASLVPPL